MLRQGLLCIVLAALIISVSCEDRDLPLNEVQTGVFTKVDDITQFLFKVPVDTETAKSHRFSVSLFPMMGSLSPHELQTPSLALIASLEPGAKYGDTNIITSAETPYQSIIIEPLNADANVTELPVYITAQALTFNSTVTYYISSTLINNALDPNNLISQRDAVFQVRGRVHSGQRLFYQFEPFTPSKIVIEECSFADSLNDKSVLSAAFLWNTTTDFLSESEYNQEYVNYPCGHDIGGNIVVTDPNNSHSSLYLKVCPTFITFSEPQAKSYFAVDVLRFWEDPVAIGYLDFSITIYTTTDIAFPLEHSKGDPDFVQIAPIDADTDNKPNLTLRFRPWKLSNGTNIVATYSVFSDFKESQSSRQQLLASNTLTSACYLNDVSHNLLWKLYQYSDLKIIDNDTVELVLENFFDSVPEQQYSYHVTIAANTDNHYGDFAYSYVTLTPDGEVQHSGIEGWAIALIVLAVIVFLIVVVGIIAVVALFAIRFKRNSYETME